MIPVSFLYEQCQRMLDEHWGYIWGTAGVKWTKEKQEKATRDMTVQYGSQWIGHMVTDCSGVMVYIWKQYGLSIPHGSSSMVKQGYIVDCSSEPKPGYAALVDPTPDTPDNEHIGIVLEDGVTVFEAKGTKAGCVTSKVTDKKWTKFGRFADVDYEEVEPIVVYRAVVNTESGSLNVRAGNGKSNPVIFKLVKGAEVDVLMEYPDGWCFVRDNQNRQGYCMGSYLKEIQPAPQDPEPDPEPATWTVSITCQSEDEAKRLLALLKGAVIWKA